MKDDHYSIEEEFHQKDRKQFRKERRLAQVNDRSKFKKTDQKKPKEAHYEADENTVRGRVLSIIGEGILVSTGTKELLCSLRGLLKKEKTEAKNLVVVGDFVQVIPSEENEGMITAVEDRVSFLAREDISGRKKQLIAANIDQVFITTSVVVPNLKPFLIDRYIIASQKGGMHPIIVINKIDLLKTDLKERLFYEEFIEVYKTLGVPILNVSTVTKEGIEELKALMKDKASVFSGQSGVGKSSLINETLGLDLPIGEVVHKTQKGSHTTTTAQLIPLAQGGFCIDTPGIKGFGIWDLKKEEVQDHFYEIKEIGKGCKYQDCLHMEEPECAVLKTLKEGSLARLRFDSYISLITDATEEPHQ
jgi:ribosome biogenesis GTPase / thiamine phosphate phosphatase